MQFPKPPGRPAKVLRVCFLCKASCLPKNGDWFSSSVTNDQQMFLCKGCERGSQAVYQRVIPIKM